MSSADGGKLLVIVPNDRRADGENEGGQGEGDFHDRSLLSDVFEDFLAACWIGDFQRQLARFCAMGGSGFAAEKSGEHVLIATAGVVLLRESGGSATQFSVDLPKDSMCPGDSENDNWRLQTFIIPGDVDPGTLTYSVIGPTGPKQYLSLIHI